MINQLRNMNVLDKIDLKIVHYFLQLTAPFGKFLRFKI
jgi:hypothetical protein